ncbi:hypothetical protein QBC36DRAFT_352710 [Triangularia setosa]|uniref:Uncharacterized protein n=1 Tax=Triangularia setosa TaxID=2587417 RepID=A0AAN6WGJ7_9PEZI|nr:hypothetical protein QBC36DRAFT_352710 [Podospora setosa]
MMATLVAMNNLTAPVAPLCNDAINPTRQSCSVTARTLSIHAECSGETSATLDRIGVPADSWNANASLSEAVADRNDTSSFCVGQGTARKLCVELLASFPNIYGALCQARIHVLPRMWQTFHSGVGMTDDQGFWAYGWKTQNGTSPPTLDRSTFSVFNPISTEFRSINGSDYHGYRPAILLNRICTEHHKSPYDFNLSDYYRPNTLYQNLFAYYFLGEKARNKAESVARQNEANFDMATLPAFAQWPNASGLVFTYTDTVPIYFYDLRVLLVLLVPFLATLFGTWSRWQVGNIKDEVIATTP